MKVKPLVKRKRLGKNEVRVIAMGEKAIEELLFENLMEKVADYFDVPDAMGDCVCHMDWDKEARELVYVIEPIGLYMSGFDLDLRALRRITGLTTDSIFKPDRYKTVVL